MHKTVAQKIQLATMNAIKSHQLQQHKASAAEAYALR